MKIIGFIFTALIIFTGCQEKDIQTQRKECREEGKKFTVKKYLTFVRENMKKKVSANKLLCHFTYFSSME